MILLAGGTGRRAGGGIPKQFQLLGELPVFLHSAVTYFHWSIASRLVLVMHPDWMGEARSLLRSNAGAFSNDPTRFMMVAGGDTRHSSVLCGIEASRSFVAPEDILLFHDAARPLLEKAELDRIADYMNQPDSLAIASLASTAVETLVTAQSLPGRLLQKLKRENIFSVKTPQALKWKSVQSLLEVQGAEDFTDLLTWGSAAGIEAMLLEAGPRNIKITSQEDLLMLNRLLSISNQE